MKPTSGDLVLKDKLKSYVKASRRVTSRLSIYPPSMKTPENFSCISSALCKGGYRNHWKSNWSRRAKDWEHFSTQCKSPTAHRTYDRQWRRCLRMLTYTLILLAIILTSYLRVIRIFWSINAFEGEKFPDPNFYPGEIFENLKFRFGKKLYQGIMRF